MSNSERSAIVTGAAGGIGRAITEALLAEGFAVTMIGRDAAKLESVAAGRPELSWMSGSLADETFLDQIVATHTDRFGSLDLLVNNAGVGGQQNVGEMTAAFVDEQLAVNLRAVILLTDKCMGLLKAAVQKRHSAQVVNIASNAGKRGEATIASYSAAKAGVIGFTEAVHDELAGAGIKATAICPGMVDTPMVDDFRDQVAPGNMLAPSDIAEAVAFTTRLSRACIIPEVVLLRPTEWVAPNALS